MGDDDPRGMANLDPRGMIGRIYVEYHLTLLHTKYTSFRPCGFREECFSHYKPMADNDAPGEWPIWTPGSKNKSSGPHGLREEDFFYVFFFLL